MAEECHKAGTLAASFFFSRTALGRNDASRLVATITYQIAYSIADAQLLIQRELENDPMVFSKSLATQLYQLVARPLSSITPDTSECWPKLIIIDGLDECNGGEIQRAIICSFASMAAQYSIPLRIMISSRPEQSIRGVFSLPDKNWAHVSLVLDDNHESTRDIALFLWDSFSDIRNTHVLKLYIPEKWPSKHDVDVLVQKSSGQFIFASTAMRYIKSPRHRPMDRLQDVLQIGKSSKNTAPFAELDVLYMHVLQSADKTQLATILKIFGFLLCTDPDYDRQPSMIEDFLGLAPGDVYLALIDYHSIINLPAFPEEIPNTHSPLHFLHASISDFLIDPARSQQFFVDRGAIHADLARACMRGVCSSQPSVRVFSSWNLIRHCESARMDKVLFEELLCFDLSDLFHSHEVHPTWAKYLSRSIPSDRYRASLDQITWIKRLFYGGKFRIPENILNRHLMSIDRHLKEQILTLAWPDRASELLTLAAELQSTPRKSAAMHWDMALPNAWNYAGILLDLDVSNAYKSNQMAVEKLYLDFLCDHKRAGRYHINGGTYARIAYRCIEYFNKEHHRGAVGENSKDESSKLHGCLNPQICSLALGALSSILSSAAPSERLADKLRSWEDPHLWLSADAARKNYLEKFDEWKRHQYEPLRENHHGE